MVKLLSVVSIFYHKNFFASLTTILTHRETEAILVFNEPKKGIDNYIGANSFVELAMAFAWNRKIYLLNDIYGPYEDELMAWNVKCLGGNLNLLIDEWNCKNKEERVEIFHQMTLEEWGKRENERD